MIYTWTLNPAIDYRLELDTLKVGGLNRAEFNKFSAGGKGINVSIILNRMGVNNIATGFVGGFTGKYFVETIKKKYDLNADFVTIKDNTRINVKLSNEQLTEINAHSPMVTDEELAKLLKKLHKVTPRDLVVLGGSGIRSQKHVYETIAKSLHDRGIRFMADLDPISLKEVFAYGPYLIKQNREELEGYFGIKVTNEKDIIECAQKLKETGAKHILISLGDEGAYYVGENVAYYAEPITGEVLNTVGTGDSMVAGFVGTLTRTVDTKKAFKWAVAAATATAFSYSLAKHEDISQLLDHVVIREVKI